MSFFNEALIKAMATREYICPECGELMIFEDEYESMLLCEHCGYSVDLDDYGADPYENLYPLKEDL